MSLGRTEPESRAVSVAGIMMGKAAWLTVTVVAAPAAAS